ALVLSSDGGPRTWGNPAAQASLHRAWTKATNEFRYDGRTFTLGLSMGGLTAALVTLQDVVPSRGLVLVAPRLNVREAVDGPDRERAAELRAAHHLTPGEAFPAGFDPINEFEKLAKVRPPAFIVVSEQDRTVNAWTNGIAFAQLLGAKARLQVVTGGHLGSGMLNAAVGAEAARFLDGLWRGAPEPSPAPAPLSARKASARAPSP
ncbi:MAG TPA: prolyl oligopeptidase family serine peptidase, partial [Deinococcales bacterium]|nr:prolyl oligopeptidase family serine peptidase [Deinococcales bacterium]